MEKNYNVRKNLRISKYNYSSVGFYFITICTKNRECILSKIYYKNLEPILKLSKLGKITEKYINAINKTYENIKINYYSIMPNHLHFICEINNKEKNCLSRANEKIPFIISTLKRLSNKECNRKIWQRNYYEHIIRNEEEYLRIIKYIKDNPFNWKNDIYYS